MTNAELMTTRTNELADKLGVADQLAGMTTAQKLADMAIRFGRLSSASGQAAAAMCLQMHAMAVRL